MWAVEAKTLPGLCLCFKPTGTRECFDHIFSHSAVWSTRKQCFQRVAESKRNGAETARNEWKSCEKSFLTSLFTAPQILSCGRRRSFALLCTLTNKQIRRDIKMFPAPAGKPFPAKGGEFFDHSFSHRAVWSIWKQCPQRVLESK